MPYIIQSKGLVTWSVSQLWVLSFYNLCITQEFSFAQKKLLADRLIIYTFLFLSISSLIWTFLLVLLEILD